MPAPLADCVREHEGTGQATASLCRGLLAARSANQVPTRTWHRNRALPIRGWHRRPAASGLPAYRLESALFALALAWHGPCKGLAFVRLRPKLVLPLATLLEGSLLWGCAPAQQVSSYRIALRVQSDPGRPLGKARVLFEGRAAGVSDERGLVQLSVSGSEGGNVKLAVECPEGYRSPSEAISAVLRRANEGDRHAEYSVSCPPVFRTVVIAVRADRGANLPILQLGREVGRTDGSGAAHVVLKSPPEESLELTLDTSSNPALRPHNPTTRFRVGQSDEILVFNQAFNLDPAKKRVGGAARARGPIRIQ